MGVIETKVFKNANGLAVQLPDYIGFDEDMIVSIETRGNGVSVMPVKPVDPVEEKRKLTEFVAQMLTLDPLPRQEREPIEFPERPGL